MITISNLFFINIFASCSSSAVIEYGKKSGWVKISDRGLFNNLTRQWPEGDAVGRHDVSSYVQVDQDSAVIRTQRYQIKWIWPK